MSPMRVLSLLRRWRRHAALTAVVLAMGGAIAVHHLDMAAGEPHDGMDMGAVMELCVGTFTAVGTAVVAVALGLWTLGRWAPVGRISPIGACWAPSNPSPGPGPDRRCSRCWASLGAEGGEFPRPCPYDETPEETFQ